jgi:tryptophanyl-tRNA synthetase
MNRTADKVSNVTLIHQSQDADSPDFYEKMENGHYNCDGMKKLGARFAEVFLRTYASPQR